VVAKELDRRRLTKHVKVRRRDAAGQKGIAQTCPGLEVPCTRVLRMLGGGCQAPSVRAVDDRLLLRQLQVGIA
jgi:hypothetical protein